MNEKTPTCKDCRFFKKEGDLIEGDGYCVYNPPTVMPDTHSRATFPVVKSYEHTCGILIGYKGAKR